MNLSTVGDKVSELTDLPKGAVKTIINVIAKPKSVHHNMYSAAEAALIDFNHQVSRHEVPEEVLKKKWDEIFIQEVMSCKWFQRCTLGMIC